MKKNYLMQWLLVLLLFLVGCRTETYPQDDSANGQKQRKLRIVPEFEIPQIITTLKAKTNNFKVPLRNHASSHGKTETAFGDVVTSYIIESTDGSSQVYYTFPILPSSGNDTSDTYNLEVKAENAEVETAKVLVYEPTADWIVIGNNDYLKFSGDVSTYSLDGTLEGTVAYINGTSDCKPCPDCPTQPQGPGNPPPPSNPGGGGTGGGGGNPPGNPGGDNPGSDPGNPGTPSVPGGDGPPPTPPAPPNNPPSGPSNGGECRVCVDWDPNTGVCKQTVPISCPGNFTANRIAAPTCGQDQDPGGGVVVTTQDDPCTVLKTQNTNVNYKAKIEALDKSSIFNLNHETGYSENKNGVFADLPVSQNTNGRDAMQLTMSATTKGYIHSHLNDRESGTYDDNGNPKMEEPVRMFSPADLDALMTMAQFQTDGNYGSLYGTMVSSDGNYTIKFTGTAVDIKTGFDSDDWRKKYREYFADKKKKGSREKKFLTFLKDEMKVSGISLYKIKSDGTIQKKELGSDGKVKSTDCSK